MREAHIQDPTKLFNNYETAFTFPNFSTRIIQGTRQIQNRIEIIQSKQQFITWSTQFIKETLPAPTSDQVDHSRTVNKSQLYQVARTLND